MRGLGVLRASLREVDDPRSKPGSPFHPFQDPVRPEPGEIYKYEFSLCPIFRTFKKGHRIWVQVASDDLGYMGEHNTVYNAYEMLPVPARNTIYHDSKYPSHILLPTIPDVPEKTPVPLPLSQVKWPLGETRMQFPCDSE